MGLDVYLYKFETPPVRGPDDDYDGGESIEINSKVHPDHMFKIGYLRSSYNGGGINRHLREYLGGHDLAWIFGNDGREYEFQPDWPACLKRCRQVQAEWKAHVKRSRGCTVTVLSFNPFIGPTCSSEKEALDAYIETVGQRKEDKDGDFNWFSNGKGEFFLGKSHLRVRAAFPGQRESYMAKLKPGHPADEPCFYVVHESDPSDGDDSNWYTKALEITAEMIEYVLGQPEPKKYWLHWSG